jgi:hypothetical protein
MHKWSGISFALILIHCGTAVAEEITVSYASLGAAYMDHIVAIEKGYALGEGLNVKIIRSGGGSATQTLLSGQLHFSSSAGSALSAALRGGPVKIIYTNLSRPTYKLLSNKPEIKTLQEEISAGSESVSLHCGQERGAIPGISLRLRRCRAADAERYYPDRNRSREYAR